MFEMRAGLSQPDDRCQAANQFELQRLRVAVVNVEPKGAARLRQMRSVKANESKPLMKGRNFTTMSKPGPGVRSGSSDGGGLSATVTTSGLEAARARIRLKHGTLEPVAPMPRESFKRGNRKEREYQREAKPPVRDTGTERPVVAMNGRNGPGARGFVSPRQGVVSFSSCSTSQPRARRRSLRRGRNL